MPEKTHCPITSELIWNWLCGLDPSDCVAQVYLILWPEDVTSKHGGKNPSGISWDTPITL